MATNLFNVTRDDLNTKFYLDAIEKMFTLLSSKKAITSDVYKELITLCPADLAARLRLVPDNNLSSRLAHLYAIYDAVVTKKPVGAHTNYSLVSIEGSCPAFPIDCDLIIYDDDRSVFVFIDFTASNNANILRRKQTVLEQNIYRNQLKDATFFVYRFIPVSMVVDISGTFTSEEPGTLGLKFIDYLNQMPENYRRLYFSSCKEVFRQVSLEIAHMDNSNPPGDYKQTDIPDGLLFAAKATVGKQSDVQSLKFLIDADRFDKEYFPYFEGLREICARSQKWKALFPIEAAKPNNNRDLVLKLAALSDNYLAKALHAACLTDSVVAINEADQVCFMSEFPVTDGDNLIQQPSNLKVAVQRKSGHVFKIKFSRTHVDPKLKRILTASQEKKDKCRLPAGVKPDDQDVVSMVEEASHLYNSDVAYFQSLSLEAAADDIWKKILTISALSSNDLENFGRSCSSLLDALVSTIRQSYAGASISHMYEVYKSILASLKVSPSDNTYYVGSNGAYNSISIVKMSSTLDSFKRCCFSVIFEHERVPDHSHTRLSCTTAGSISMTSFYSSDPNQLSYGLRLPYIWVSLASWEMENNMDSGAIANGVLSKVIIDSAFTALINRDQFAQASEQVRYFYMSAIGYGGSAPEIVDKTTFIRTRHHWEVLYLMRAYKMSAALCSISCRSALSDIEDRTTRELSVAFPHSSFPSKSFSQTISSMYICNIFNKFRAFHEVSEAICYNEVMDELAIYNSRVAQDINAVSGLSPFFFHVFKDSLSTAIEYVCSPKFIAEEVKFGVSLAVLKSNRYSGSMTYITGATDTFIEVPDSTIDIIYERLNRAPIEACTMRGSMDDGESTVQHQGIRAASAVLEHCVRTTGLDPKNVNKSVLGAAYLMDKVQETKATFSIISCVIEQFNDGSIIYRYRIVQKDQKGSREISVLNIHFRMGALFVEVISRELSACISEVEIANNPNKDKIIEDTIMDTFSSEQGKQGVYCYDNSDQKRWGPNHNMNFFSYAMSSMLKKDPGLSRLVNRVFDLTFAKRAKFPESLIDLMVKKKITASRSSDIDRFIRYALPKINNQIFETKVAQGMCQGIYQATSSVVHAIKSKAQGHVVTELHPTVSLKFLATSDDAECVEFIPYGKDRLEVVRNTHSIGLRVGNLFNIVRSNPKSAFNFHIAELNSIFFKRGSMATPALKQRISKIDVGMGINHIEDFLSALAASSNYLSAGGSYMGTVILSILNITLHTEQWLRWEFVTSDNFYKPVELGGFPVIEPITTVLSGGLANFYQRSAGLLTSEEYSKLVVASLLCPPEELSLADFARTGSDALKKSLKLDEITIFKGTGPLGMFQMVRTDRKLSQFERRHGISQWAIPDSFVTIRRDSPMASDFLFSIFRGNSVSTLDTNLGVNSFFIRMAEPWVSFVRPCFRMSKFSPFNDITNNRFDMISHKEFNDIIKAYSLHECRSLLQSAARKVPTRSEFEIMEAQLSVRFRDAQSILEFFSSQEAESFKLSYVKPSIQRVTLRGHTASDSDSYMLAIIKSLSGKRSQPLINEYKRSAVAYDSINVPEPKDPVGLTSAIIIADNTIALYNKFIRRDTKMILPNRVDSLRELCVDILRNKFAERLGMVLEGTIELDDSRMRPYAHSKWYQELLDTSAKFETSVANAVLRGASPPAAVVGIMSARAVITRSDMFELTTPVVAERTILVDAKSKDSFVNTLRQWVSANVSVVLSRETIASLISGKLTFAHDYFVGSNSFYRYAKKKYLTLTAGGSTALHTIQTTVKEVNNKRKTTYRHIFIFQDDVTGRTLNFTKSDPNDTSGWLANLIDNFGSTRVPAMDKWIPIKQSKSSTRLDFRKTPGEQDFVIFKKITPGTSFKITSEPGSLCMFLSSPTIKLPITYLNPTTIEEFRIGYVLKDSDLKVATRAYTQLRKATDGFNKDRIRYWREMEAAMDFILVGSTTDTPPFIINKTLSKFIGFDITPVQLDLLRTFLIKHKSFGVAYSSTRFTQYLLNMGNRRNHFHSFLCRKAMGDMADQDSEDWDNHSAQEDVLVAGKTDPHTFVEVDIGEEAIIPSYLEDFAVLNQRFGLGTGSGDWADEVIEAAENEATPDELITQSIPIVDLFEDSSSESGESAHTDIYEASVNEVQSGNVQVATPIVSTETQQAQNMIVEKMAEFGLDLLGDLSFDDLFDPEDPDQAATESGKMQAEASDSLDKLFKIMMEGTYEKMIDVKDKKLQSEKSGHTVNPTIENARAVISYLKKWIDHVGSKMTEDLDSGITKNVSSVTGIYLTLHDLGVLSSINPLEKFYGLDNMTLPVELSALAVVDTIYG